MDDFEKRRLNDEQVRASDRAADASEHAAAAARAVQSEMAAMRFDAERRERQREEQERERLFGTAAFCISFITRALILNPALKGVLRDHYAPMLTEAFTMFWKVIEQNKNKLNGGGQKTVEMGGLIVIPTAVRIWTAAFGPLPNDLTGEPEKCRQEVERFRERVRVFQQRQRRNTAMSWALVVLCLIGWAVLASVLSKSSPTKTAPAAIPQRVVPSAPSKHASPSSGPPTATKPEAARDGPRESPRKEAADMSATELDQWLHRDKR